MTDPLALVLYEKLLPGSQLVNRLQDLKYRVHNLTDPKTLVTEAQLQKPMVVLVDLPSEGGAVCEAIKQLKENPATKHLPVVAFTSGGESAQVAGQACGATLVVSDSAILTHLSEFLEQALHVE